MAKKKSDKTEVSAAQQELEQRVDAMMSVEPPAKTAAPAEPASLPAQPAENKSPAAPAEPQSTAPLLPTKLLKAIGADKKIKSKAPAERRADVAVSIGEPADKPKPQDEAVPEEPAGEAENTEPAEPAKAEAAAEPPLPPEPEQSRPPEKDILEDSATDKAVDDIVAHEADTQLAVDDAVARHRTAEAESRNQQGLLAAFFTSPWTWLIIIGTITVLYLWYR